ncbi:transposase [Bremerella sp. TYQ1]|uniref:REP-associated tyrosine transposase n=1 Tax=Bremerella sp. TYQ1 TaxID=3119568 RepID=UPI001CC9631E|nr:transposase [Bremerella volcania]UBM33691.1 transposase [Bremerella volcania]
MPPAKIPSDQLYFHFVTYSCYKRRRILEFDDAKRIVLGSLTELLKTFDAMCQGFVLMPNHVHLVLWFPQPGTLGTALREWKRNTSFQIKVQMEKRDWAYRHQLASDDPIWQANFYSFEIYCREKLEEKLIYMHQNPVRAGLTSIPTDWKWSSARWYDEGRSVGIPIRIPEF